MSQKILIVAGSLVGIILLVGLINFLIIMSNGKPVAAPNIPRDIETYGSGPEITYAVLGDSTTVGQGGDYDKGIARETARYLAAEHTVTFQNFGVSGARAADVESAQVAAADRLKPDVVLIAVGANDVTHLTSINSIEKSLTSTIQTLRGANPDVQIILTGSASMGDVSRFPQPARLLAGVRTDQVNKMVGELSNTQRVIFAPIARDTGPVFRKDPSLFAQDNFHPNTAGYQVWIPTLTRALSKITL